MRRLVLRDGQFSAMPRAVGMPPACAAGVRLVDDHVFDLMLIEAALDDF